MPEIDNSRITSIRIEWVNNGLSCLADENIWQLTVYRNRGTQNYITKDGYKKILREEKYGLHDFQREQIFSLLEEIDAAGIWANDFSVDICDGSSYSIRLTYSDRHTRTVFGTVMFPPRWNELLTLLRMMQECPLDGARDMIEWIQHEDEIDISNGNFYMQHVCRNCASPVYEGKYCMNCGASLHDKRPQLINYGNIPPVYGPPPEYADVVCRQCGTKWSVSRPWRGDETRKVYCPECGLHTEVADFGK